MAKIDVTQIEGYEDMTPEEKISALEAIEFDDHADELNRFKAAVSKANSEAADWKKKHNALLSEEEKKKQEQEEAIELMKQEIADYKNRELTAKYKAEYLALGMDETLANETADAMSKGEMETVFANQKKFLENHDKDFKAELLKDTPKPKTGEDGKVVTQEQFDNMDYAELNALQRENPELYSELSQGGN